MPVAHPSSSFLTAVDIYETAGVILCRHAKVASRWSIWRAAAWDGLDFPPLTSVCWKICLHFIPYMHCMPAVKLTLVSVGCGLNPRPSWGLLDWESTLSGAEQIQLILKDVDGLRGFIQTRKTEGSSNNYDPHRFESAAEGKTTTCIVTLL